MTKLDDVFVSSLMMICHPSENINIDTMSTVVMNLLKHLGKAIMEKSS